ncbi:hypothetical protein YC2023_016938 [Brassica napus]
MEMLVPEFDNNYNYLQPVNGQAMLPVELEMVYGPNPNQELQFGSGYNFYNPFAVFVNNQEQDPIHMEVNAPHNNEFEPHGLHGNEEKDLSPQFQSDSNILSPFINERLIVADFTKDKASPSYPSKNKQTFINLVGRLLERRQETNSEARSTGPEEASLEIGESTEASKEGKEIEKIENGLDLMNEVLGEEDDLLGENELLDENEMYIDEQEA